MVCHLKLKDSLPFTYFLVLNGPNFSQLLKKRWWKEVIVYDDSSESLERLPASHTLFLVMSALVEDGREPKMLLGGLKDFQEGHRSQHCEDHLMTTSDLASKTSSLSGAGVHGEAPSTLLPDLPSPTEMCDTKDIENHPATRVSYSRIQQS